MVLKQLHQMGYLGHLTARDERSALNLGTEFKSCIYSLEYRVHSIEMLGGFTSFRSLELYSQFLSNPDDFLSEHIKIILYTSMIRYRHS